MNRHIFSILAILLLLPASIRCAAATPAPPQISILTAAEGREIYQLEGHAALRLKYDSGIDMVVNWGVFDFNSPNFVYRFVKGETDYLAAAYPFNYFLSEYMSEGRRVDEYILDLSPSQITEVERLVAENLLPQNATYRYNYVLDNCSTRPLQLVERASGAPLNDTADETDRAVTFRSEMTRYHGNYPWYQFGIDLCLGSGIDRPITHRERTFAPVFLGTALPGIEIADSIGAPNYHPLVREHRVLNAGESTVIEGPTPWYATPLAVAWYLLLITIGVTLYDICRNRRSRWFDTLLYGIFFLVGCMLTFLIFVSVHEATSPNWLYLWLNPLCIIPAIGVWLNIKWCKRAVYCYQICNFAALFVLLCCHRWLGQELNPAFPLLIICDIIRSVSYIYFYNRASATSSLAIPKKPAQHPHQ